MTVYSILQAKKGNKSATIKMLCVTFVLAASFALVTSTSLGSENNGELIELLQRLQENLEKNAKDMDAKSEVRTLHDEVRVVRYHGITSRGSQVKPSTRSGPGLTGAQQTDLVDAINKARRNEGANDMYKIRWNSELADLAQQWSDQCQFRHGTPLFEGAEIGFYDLGQNNYASTGPFSAAAVIADWMSEKPFYNAATTDCTGKSCDRYKQLMWGYTTDVGCGLTQCDSIGDIGSGNFLVCYFGPPGMFYGEKPFIAGAAPCSKCASGQFYCNNGLCDATCSEPGSTCVCNANCQNCATTLSNCRCQCKPGSVGIDCSSLCTDLNPSCGRDWPKYLCNYGLAWVNEQCPKMCKQCVVGNPCASTRSRNSLSDLYRHFGVEED